MWILYKEKSHNLSGFSFFDNVTEKRAKVT